MADRKKRRISLTFKIFSLMLALLLISLPLVGRFFYFNNKALLEDQIGSNLEHIAATTVLMIDAEQLESIVDKRDFFSSEYTGIRNLLARVKRINRLDAPLYALRRVGNSDEVEFIVSSDDVSTLLGARYELRKEMLPAFQNGISAHTQIYSDKSGMWISAYAPIKNKIGEVIAILEVDHLITGFLNKLRQEIVLITSFSMLAAVIGLVFILPLLGPIRRSLMALEVAADELRKGNYDFKVNIRTNDEIGSLAGSFESLRVSLKDYISQLKNAWIEEKKAHLDSIIALSKAIEIRDPYTRGHLERVSRYSELIARELNLPEKEIERLKYGCILHDVGKIGVDMHIIQKPTRLSESEYEEIKKHPAMGAQIIEEVEFLKQVKDMILYHQERYDGTGYPFGLKGEDIPILARIIAVTDVFDALTSDRPYRTKMSDEEALGLMRKESGRHFDPKIVEIFFKIKDKIFAARDEFEKPA